MVNCNPETVSTDYDTSDRLYFEPLDTEEVLAVCEREQPDGVVIQFGGQTPLKLARAIEEAGYRILGTPFDAVDLAEDRERFGALLARLGIRCPEWGIAESGRRGGRDRRADRLPGARPALVRARRPRDARLLPAGARCARRSSARSTGGCSSTASSRTRSRSTSTRSATATTRTSPRSCSTSRRRASTRATRPACCPRRRSTAATAAEIARDRRGRSRRRSASSGCSTSSSRSPTATSTCSRRTRAPRARCRSRPRRPASTSSRRPAGSRRGEARASSGCRPSAPPQQVSVKAAVLPFARFPGSDPVLGPEMRSTGEVMASAADLPTAFAKAERAAGRPLPTTGTAFLSVRDADKAALVPDRGRARRARLRAARDRRAPPQTLARRRARGRAGAQGRRGGRRRRPSST